jgi:hypothetical protein
MLLARSNALPERKEIPKRAPERGKGRDRVPLEIEVTVLIRSLILETALGVSPKAVF